MPHAAANRRPEDLYRTRRIRSIVGRHPENVVTALIRRGDESWPVARDPKRPCPAAVSAPDSARSGACSDVLRRAAERLRARDVDGDALRRALRAAIVVPIAGIVSYSVAGFSQTTLFTLLGAIWLLGLVDFPGNRQVRAPAYCGLGFNGAVLITIGTLVQPIPWLAVALTFVLGAAVTLAGVLSETIAAGRRVTLLLFVLPVCTPPAPVTDAAAGVGYCVRHLRAGGVVPVSVPPPQRSAPYAPRRYARRWPIGSTAWDRATRCRAQ